MYVWVCLLAKTIEFYILYILLGCSQMRGCVCIEADFLHLCYLKYNVAYCYKSV